MRSHRVYHTCFCLLMAISSPCLAQEKDSTALLEGVQVSGTGKRNSFTGSIPSQTLDRRALNQVNAPSAGDAAKYFSGVLVRDYGGMGGLKTVSIRSLGGTHTGVLYDGIAISELQSGQVDLGRYSAGFLQSLDVYQANSQLVPATARSFSFASLVSMQTKAFSLNNRKEWMAGLRQGSFGMWQPFAAVNLPIRKNMSLQASTEFTRSTGDYPLHVDNGVLSFNSRRQNSGLDSWQGELNLSTLFKDSSLLQVKYFGYLSERGLPGSINFNNQASRQQLRNRDHFLQTRYTRDLPGGINLLVSGKFNYGYTRYTDPDFLNNAGGLDNRYRQLEYYASAAAGKEFGRLLLSLASDIAYTTLWSNASNYAAPTRLSLWNNLLLKYHTGKLELSAAGLLSSFRDHNNQIAAASRSKLTPTFSASFRPREDGPFLIRAFYKEVFRMPTFSDLYYRLVGNSNLRPEYASQYNAGLVFNSTTANKPVSVRASLDVYYNRIRDKIIAVPSQNLFIWTMLNLGKVEIIGTDLAAELNGPLGNNSSWYSRLAYTYQQATDRTDKSSTVYGDRIPYTPDHSGSAMAGVNLQRWSAGLSQVFSSIRYSIGENNPSNQLDGWGTTDFFISRVFRYRRVKIDAKAELNNISDERYDVVRAYPMPGRSYRLTLTLSNQ